MRSRSSESLKSATSLEDNSEPTGTAPMISADPVELRTSLNRISVVNGWQSHGLNSTVRLGSSSVTSRHIRSLWTLGLSLSVAGFSILSLSCMLYAQSLFALLAVGFRDLLYGIGTGCTSVVSLHVSPIGPGVSLHLNYFRNTILVRLAIIRSVFGYRCGGRCVGSTDKRAEKA